MNAASNGTQDAERDRLFREIATLRESRNDLMTKLTACRRECAELRDQLAQLKGEK